MTVTMPTMEELMVMGMAIFIRVGIVTVIDSALVQGQIQKVLKMCIRDRVMYDTHRGQGGESADVAGLLERADEVSEKIREVKARVSDLRQSRTCPACGASCGKEDKYCRGCGAPL